MRPKGKYMEGISILFKSKKAKNKTKHIFRANVKRPERRYFLSYTYTHRFYYNLTLLFNMALETSCIN